MKRLILFELIILFLATTFESDSPPGWYQQVLPVNDQINDIFFLDSLTGWVVTNSNLSSSDSGYIMKTIDGGSNWNIQHKGVVSFNVVQFLDNNTGYAGAVDPLMKFYKTTNSGNNWLVVSSLLTGLTDVFFVNSNTGWYCDPSGFGGLYRTTNGGVNWEQQLNDSYQPIKLFFINKDTGWAGSSNNRLYRTTNSGVNWGLQYTSNIAITSIFFLNGTKGWIRAGGGNGVAYTTNSGVNWTVAQGEFSGGDIKFVNDSIGLAAGGNQPLRITRSTDGGKNWGYQTAQVTPDVSVAMLRSDTSNAWAGKQILVHTSDGGGQMFLGIHQINNEVPTEYRLYQNYPNPFNPVTNIKYSLKSQTSNVKLVVYDIQGRFITELVNQEQNAGTYLADWNASGFASGLYFYSLIVDGVIIDTRKMILVK